MYTDRQCKKKLCKRMALNKSPLFSFLTLPSTVRNVRINHKSSCRSNIYFFFFFKVFVIFRPVKLSCPLNNSHGQIDSDRWREFSMKSLSVFGEKPTIPIEGGRLTGRLLSQSLGFLLACTEQSSLNYWERGSLGRILGRLFCEIRISLPAIVIITHLTSRRID